MKKIIAISIVAAAAMTSIGAANAANLTVQGYTGWAQSAMNTGSN